MAIYAFPSMCVINTRMPLETSNISKRSSPIELLLYHAQKTNFILLLILALFILILVILLVILYQQ